jgi:hypothetical protein
VLETAPSFLSYNYIRLLNIINRYMKHKHHIIPRHAGGTDALNNIVELTVEEHAKAHRVLYEKYGRWQDPLKVFQV